jgi:hypothetical protein
VLNISTELVTTHIMHKNHKKALRFFRSGQKIHPSNFANPPLSRELASQIKDRKKTGQMNFKDGYFSSNQLVAILKNHRDGIKTFSTNTSENHKFRMKK